MLKATLRSAVLLGLLAISAPSYAEVQNVKVGGEVTVRGFARKSMRASEDVINGVGGTSTGAVFPGNGQYGSSQDNFMQQLTAINVGADLTENVSTQLRVINQRVWGNLTQDAVDGTGDANQVDLSLANVTLKELFYSPLSVTLGRQRLWYGRGFIVGNRLLEGDFDPEQALGADEFSDMTGFDAIKGVLDLSQISPIPVTLDAVYAKVDENEISVNGATDSSADDKTLLGLNLGTKFSMGEAEIYYWNKRNNETENGQAFTLDTNPQSNTLGVRGSVAPVEGLSTWGEMAYQWGHRMTTPFSFDAEGATGDPYSAWAMNFGADYTAKEVAWSPTVGAEWIFYSGSEGAGCANSNFDTDCTDTGEFPYASAIGGWEPVYRGSFSTAIREFQGAGLYMPAQSAAVITNISGSNTQYNPLTNSYTNEHQFGLHGTVRPLQDLTVDNRYTWFIADEGIVPVAGSKRHSYIGGEYDLQASYNYTDDVQFGLIYAVFTPGSVFRHPFDDIAQELVTSVDVKF